MKYLVSIVLLVAAGVFACASGLPTGVIYPSIDPDAETTGTVPVSAAFTFEGEPMVITAEVDNALYAGAVSAEKTVTRFGNAHADDWIEQYFPSFVDDPHEDPFYDAVIAQFRRIRDERGLDRDRYAELMTCYVQSIEYRTDPTDLEPKFPVETFVDGAGDCDDKTLLLAALLSHEGYDVAVLLFEPEKHVALGIRCDQLDYRGTGYAYTETTTEGFIGMVPEEFVGGLQLTSQPQVFAIGNGTLEYTAGDEVATIIQDREQAREEARSLAQNIARTDADLRQLQADVQDAQQQLDALRAEGRTAQYDQVAARYNQIVRRYNEAIARRNSLAERHNRLVDIGQIIVRGLDDRAGTFAAVLGAH